MIKHIELIVGAYLAEVVEKSLKSAAKKYFSNFNVLPPGDWDDYELALCQKVIPFLEEHDYIDKPLEEIRKILISYFSKCISNSCRNESAKKAVRAKGCEKVQEVLYPTQGGEHFGYSLDIQFIRDYIRRAPEEIREYCEMLMVFDIKEEARKELGWSKGRFYRVAKKVEDFFAQSGEIRLFITLR